MRILAVHADCGIRVVRAVLWAQGRMPYRFCGHNGSTAEGRAVTDGTVRRSPNMYDVAARAGVSHQTVSRVVNGFGSIRPETRDRVLAAIAELGYRRNVAARTLATRRSRAIGVLAPAVTDYGPTSTVQGIEVAARTAGYHSLVTTAADDRDSIVSGLGFLLDQAIEALVVIAPQQRVLEALRALDIRLPIATLQAVELGSGTAVSVDQSAGARLVMDHLLELGHRRIQHLAGPDEFLEAAARRGAYERALESSGLRVPEIVVGDWTAESGYRAASRLDPSTTAVFSGNDQMALGLVHGLVALGRRVPHDVSVVGFDDVPEAKFYLPALTTVRQDFGQIGRVAVESLIRQIEGGPAEHIAPLEAQLVVRESTAPPSS
jgi:DNA-binding LacI/PurR family transcriptional regulator